LPIANRLSLFLSLPHLAAGKLAAYFPATMALKAPEQMSKDYIEQRDGGYWIGSSRVSLDSVVYAFLRGASPEDIVQSFPVLHLEEVYGALAFYLGHQSEIDSYLETGAADFESLRAQLRTANRSLYQKLEEAREQSRPSRR
jgi:uncharacterized protein (DUF433 family)